MTDTTSAAPSDAEVDALYRSTFLAMPNVARQPPQTVPPMAREFARAVLARWGAPQPVMREPLSDEQIVAIWMEKPRYHAAPIGVTDIEFARSIERAHGITGDKA